MSILVVGLSHRSAPLGLLERAAVVGDDLPGLLAQIVGGPHVGEAVVLSTCNRVELYAVVDKFHGGVEDLTGVLAAHADIDLDELTPHLYVHYDERAVQHLFGVVCGLDSMVVGESQVLGQTRTALRLAQESGSAGSLLNDLFQGALRVGKRAHAETGIDRAGSTLVTVGLQRVGAALGGLAGARVLVIGAGSMGSLIGVGLKKSHVASVTVANRTLAHGARLAESLAGTPVGLDALPGVLGNVDLIVSCTGTTGPVVTQEMVQAARARMPQDQPLAVLDLALPRDVEVEVAELPGLTVVSLDDLSAELTGAEHLADIEAVRRIAAEEVTAYLSAQRAARVAPTVVALRQLASDVVEAELARLDARLPELGEAERAEIAQTVRRTVDKLLHAPTVRMKELAADEGGHAYAEALHRLFDLDPDAVDLVARAARPEEVRA